MREVQLQLFGDFCLTYDGNLINTINTPRLRALVAYLALHRHTPPARRHLAFLFWPDSSEAQALTNLRKQLLYLRKALPNAAMLLHTTRHPVEPKLVRLRSSRAYLVLSRSPASFGRNP